MTETIGHCRTFQIHCIHEPFPGSEGYVFGRMCLRFGDDVLGDIHEPACMLDVTARAVELALEHLAGHDEPGLSALTDEQFWECIDSALYRDDDRTFAQVAADATRYRRFDFLTNGGESFDRSRSFFVAGADDVRILFENDGQQVTAKRVDRRIFVETLRAWLQWLDHESANAKATAERPATSGHSGTTRPA